MAITCLRASLGTLLILGRVTAALAGDDWPQFHGPGGSGSSAAAGLPVRWGKNHNVRWKAPLPGQGHSSPVVAGGRVFVTATSGFEERKLHVICLDQATGRERWHRRYDATGSTLCHPKSNVAAATPATDGRAVYALFATGDLAALDADGNLLWYRALTADYPPLANNVGMAASPVLWRDVLVVPMDNSGDSYVAGIDARTGQTRWKTPRTRELNWVSPLLVADGDDAIVVLGAIAGLTAYDVRTGRPRWTFATGGFSNTSTPVSGEGLILMPGNAFTAVRMAAGLSRPTLAWQSGRLRPSITSPTYYRGRVYALNPPNVLICANAADGKVLWQQRLADGNYWSSPVAADGKVYVGNDAGVTTVVRVGDRPEVLARNTLADPILATPAIAAGCLMVRTDRYLYCIAGTAK